MIKKYIKERRGLILFILVLAILMTWGYISVSNARRNAKKANYEFVPAQGNVDVTREGSYQSVARSEKMELFFNEAKGSIKLKDLENGYEWKSVVDDEVYDTSKLNKQWDAYLKSVFTLNYNDLAQRDAPPVKVFSARDCDFMEAEYLDNGVSVRYGFTQTGIYLTIVYTLEEDNLVVRIPGDKIEESSQYMITSMELLPYFGAAGDEVDGYMVYPDGSGGITRYENVTERPGNIKAGMWRTYSNRTTSMEELMETENYERYTAALPVFGIKNNENALLAAFTQGEENSGILCYPSGYVVNLNHIGFEIYWRNVFDVDMFNVSSAIGEKANGKMIQRVDKELLKEDKEIRFFLLNSEKANYSGMADSYRSYLLKEGKLAKSLKEGDPYPLALSFLMGVTKSQMIFDEYIKMTSFSELIEIMDRLGEKGVDASQTVLKSWHKDGERYPAYWPAAGQLGGGKGLAEVNSYVKEHPGHRIYLENNFNLAIQENGGFSATKDVVYDGLNLPVSAGYDTNWFLLNPQVSFKRNEGFLDKLKSFDSLGVGYEYMGRMVYPDYNDNASFTRTETAAKWREVFAGTKESGHNVAVNGMNQYSYTNVDYLYDISESSFGLAITDDSIPFVQMVVSGLIPYSTGYGNLSYDLDIQKLKWMEYGSLPNFILTYEDAVNLKETDYSTVFTSTFDKWEDRVVDIYLEFKENFQSLYGKQMVSHEILGPGIIRVLYEGGTEIFINYNEEDVEMEGIRVPAKDYVMRKGGEAK